MTGDFANRVTFDLDNPRDYQRQIAMYRPGDTVSGTVQILTQSNVNADRVEIGLIWRTQGRGTVDQSIVATLAEPISSIMPGVPATVRFRLQLTPYPWSYSGNLITIVWSVVAKVPIGRRKSIDGEVPIIVSPLA